LDGDRVKVNAEIIPAEFGLAGNTYELQDTTVQPGITYFYWMETIEINGSNQLFGPTTITVLRVMYLPLIVR
jgi:hypothetical protein